MVETGFQQGGGNNKCNPLNWFIFSKSGKPYSNCDPLTIPDGG
jgi:hypothetical protein